VAAQVEISAAEEDRCLGHVWTIALTQASRLNSKTVSDWQGELFPGYRHNGVFTDRPLTMLQAEKSHSDRRASHRRPEGQRPCTTTFRISAGNGAWLVLAAIAINLTRAAGALASVFHAKATTATIRRRLMAVPGRLARSARRLVIHLPSHWPWQDSLGRALQRGLWATHPGNDLTTQPQQGPTKEPVEKPDMPAVSSCPHCNDRIRMALGNNLFSIYGWIGTTATLAFIVSYIAVSVAAPVYLLRIGDLKARHVVVAVIAVAFLLVAFVGAVYPLPPSPAQWPIVAFVVLLVAGFAFGVVQFRRSTDLQHGIRADLAAIDSRVKAGIGA
jgi:hypothetical protein